MEAVVIQRVPQSPAPHMLSTLINKYSWLQRVVTRWNLHVLKPFSYLLYGQVQLGALFSHCSMGRCKVPQIIKPTSSSAMSYSAVVHLKMVVAFRLVRFEHGTKPLSPPTRIKIINRPFVVTVRIQ
jgi:hypothetical protein